MSTATTIFGVAPFVAVTAVLTWGGTVWGIREKRKLDADAQADRLEIHRDDLTFQLLTAARNEVTAAYSETKVLRDEVSKLRSLEQSFFHFLQALDHIEAVCFADTDEIKKAAERNAKAFLKRMRRLNEAKGTLANEAQLNNSVIKLAEGKIARVDTDPMEASDETS